MQFSQIRELVERPECFARHGDSNIHMSSKICEKMPYGALEDGWIE